MLINVLATNEFLIADTIGSLGTTDINFPSIRFLEYHSISTKQNRYMKITSLTGHTQEIGASNAHMKRSPAALPSEDNSENTVQEVTDI